MIDKRKNSAPPTIGSLVRLDFENNLQMRYSTSYSLYYTRPIKEYWQSGISKGSEKTIAKISRDSNLSFLVISFEYNEKLRLFILDLLGSDGELYTDAHFTKERCYENYNDVFR